MAEGEDAARSSMFQKAVVGVRLRPLSRRKSDMCPKDDEDAVTFDEAAGVVNILVHRLPFHPELWLDECHFSEDMKQGAEGQLQLYDRLVTPIVEAAIRGRPDVVLAYGQTGTGKTYTIRGPSECPGALRHALAHIFGAVNRETVVTLSIMEQLYDLSVERRPSTGLRPRARPSQRRTALTEYYVDGLTHIQIYNLTDGMAVVDRTIRNMSIAPTRSIASDDSSYSNPFATQIVNVLSKIVKSKTWLPRNLVKPV